MSKMDKRQKEPRARRTFTAEYKEGAVRLVLDENRPVGQVARDLDLTASALSRWVEQARADRSDGKTGRTTSSRGRPVIPCQNSVLGSAVLGFTQNSGRKGTRFVVGWALSLQNDRYLTMKTLEMAILRRCPGTGLLHHSDRGSTYASQDYQQQLALHGITCSMSRPGNCLDNAAMESWNSTLKSELGDPQPIQKRASRVPRAVASLVHKMLAKEPSERPSMQQVSTELHRLSMRFLKADVPSGAEKHIPMLSKSQLELDLLFALLKRIVFREDVGTRKRLAHVLLLPLLLLPGEKPLAAQRLTIESVHPIPTESSPRPVWPMFPPAIEVRKEVLMAQDGSDASTPVLWPLLPAGTTQQATRPKMAKRVRNGPGVSGPKPDSAMSSGRSEPMPPITKPKSLTQVITEANKDIPFEEESESHHDK